MSRKFIPRKETASALAASAPSQGVAESEIADTPVLTNVPGREPIELARSYRAFADYYRNCEPRTKAWFANHVRRDWVILDCGANVGIYSILCAQIASEGRIYAFEPTSTIDILEANLAHHGVTNVEALRVGVGLRTGKVRERVYRIWGGDPENEMFEFTTIDDFVESRGLERLDCIKIDVDSHDFDVLRGAERTLERLNPWVSVEVNYALRKRGIQEAEVYRWLADRGYTDALVLDGENLILKRGVSPAENHDRPTASLTMWLDRE